MNEPMTIACERNLALALEYGDDLAPAYWVARHGEVLKVARGLLTLEERRLIEDQMIRAAGWRVHYRKEAHS